jgi:uncharacterized protein (TIGR02147 family)
MKKQSIFSFNTYKALMASLLSGPRHRGELTRAASALNCQRSYLSRIVTGDLHLTPDHAFNLASFWKFNSSEREYFLLLVDFERAGDRNYREFLKLKIQDLKKKNESIAERTDRKNLILDAHQAAYFSSWVWSAIHFLTSIPQYQSIGMISSRLGLKQEIALNYLVALEQQGFVVKSGEHWKYRSGDFHAPPDSPFVLLHHQNWRMRAMIDAQNFQSDSVHFTGVHTLSIEDSVRIKDLLLSFISEVNSVAGPSNPEECVVLNCDFFKV